MKKILFFLLISVGLNAQFNYQAIVKDSDGNPVTNNQVKFKFSLMYQSSTASPVYVEEHTVTTPPDGVNNLSVGGGTVVNGTFSGIDWSQSVFMKEELDTGSGYQDMGTKQIASVPVAEYSKAIDNVSFYGSQNIHIGQGENTFLGLVTNTISIGLSSGVFSNGSNNVFLGRLAGMQIKGSENIGIGNNSMIGGFDVIPNNGNNNEVSNYNTAIGFNSLSAIDGGDYNTALGWNSLNSNTTGYNNIAVGTDALSSNVTGTDNLAIGNGALFQNLAQRNLAIGASSLENNTSGTINTSVGFQSMQFNDTGSENTSIGDSSLYSNIDGDFNVAVGRNSISNNETGDMNVGVGDSALYENLGSKNTALGTQAGQFLNTENSSENTFIGYYANTVSGTVIYNSTAIGARAVVTTSNTIQLGDDNVELINTSGVINAYDFQINGESVSDILSSMATTQSDITSLSTQVNALSAAVDDLENNSGTSTSNNSFLETYNNSYFSYPSGSSTIVIKFSNSEIFMSFYSNSGECYDVQSTYRVGFNQYSSSNTITSIERNTENSLVLKIMYSSGTTKTLEFDTSNQTESTFKVYDLTNGLETNVELTFLEVDPSICP